MRIQLKNKVIEPNVNESGTDSSDDELNLAIEQDKEKTHFYNFKSLLEEINAEDQEGLASPSGYDEQMKELVLACVRTKNPIVNNLKKYKQDGEPNDDP